MDEAYVALDQLADLHGWHAYLRFDPLFEELRRDPRFSAFCKKVGPPALTESPPRWGT